MDHKLAEVPADMPATFEYTNYSGPRHHIQGFCNHENGFDFSSSTASRLRKMRPNEGLWAPYEELINAKILRQIWPSSGTLSATGVQEKPDRSRDK